MTDRLAHRGPDAAGMSSHEGDDVAVQLAIRRLSIIDLSTAANQPFRKDGLALIYNGELYNYRVLRPSWWLGVVAFRTESDTEVVLEAWRCWGPAALRRFRGMFAFALFDDQTGELFARARPARHQAALLPAPRQAASSSRRSSKRSCQPSEPSCGSTGRAGRVDALLLAARAALRDRGRAASFRPDPGPSFHPDGSCSVAAYWVVAEVGSRCGGRARRPTCGAVIEESVTAHLVADVPVSTLPLRRAGLEHRHGPRAPAQPRDRRVHDHVPGPRTSGSRRCPTTRPTRGRSRAQYGIELHEIEIAPDVVELLPRIVDILDEPIGDPAAINTLLICEAARDAGVKVLLSGMGADELFGGYRKHLACVMASAYQRLPACAPARRATAVSAAAGRGRRAACATARWAKRFLTFADLPEEAAFRRSYTLYDADDLAVLLEPRPRPVTSTRSSASTLRCTTTTRCPITSTGCASRTAGCSFPD